MGPAATAQPPCGIGCFGATRRQRQQAKVLKDIHDVISSVYHQRGQSFVWIFPRQSGKDESLAILIQYLLTYYMDFSAGTVFFNPTFKPQAETSMRRLELR